MQRIAILLSALLCAFVSQPVFAQWTVFDTINSDIPGNFIYDTEVVNTTVFVATEQGVGLFNGFDWESFTAENSNLPGNNVREILRVGNALWFATGSGIGVYENNSWTTYTEENSDIPSNNVRDLITYGGAVYAATINGLAKFSSGTWTVFNTSNSELPTNNLQALGWHSDGSLVIGTESSGVVVTDFTMWQKFNQGNSNLPSNIVLSVSKSTADVVVGTWGEGFAILRENSFEVYSKNNSGLSDDGIQSVYEDSCGRIWAATRNGGVSVVDQGRWRTFSESNSPFPSRRATSVQFSAGTWYFGSDEGLVLFTPEALIESPGIDSDIFCAGDGFVLPFTVFGDFGPGNKFVAQLSDKDGNFMQPTDIGIVAQGCSGGIEVVIPDNTKAGDFYELRIMSTNPVGLLEPSIGPISINKLPSPTISGDAELCHGDTTVLDPGSYAAYTWSDGSNERRLPVFESGTYSVEVVDGNGCIGEASFQVLVRDSLSVSVDESITLCEGESTTLSVSLSAEVVSASWSPIEGLDNPFALEPTLTIVTSGTYTLVVQDNLGCVAYDTLNIVALPSPSKPLVIQQGDTLVCTSANVQQFLWWKDGTALLNQTDSILLHPENAEYQIAISNANGCVSVSDPFRPIVNSVHEISGETTISVESTTLRVHNHGSDFRSVALFDLMGRQLLVAEQPLLQLAGVPSGSYVVLVKGRSFYQALKVQLRF